ncbi:ORF4 [Ranid herpesvirus 2]|uniref:ORF4 n=1 Tax=Ranid herpesvirus 2 TaxID=389214 RepID=Q14WA2_9VIRU|nr:ORF4 [Ranid herpesvirus 2]ABG25570.1 ORF4 [Ranid herpesvirus 2]
MNKATPPPLRETEMSVYKNGNFVHDEEEHVEIIEVKDEEEESDRVVYKKIKETHPCFMIGLTWGWAMAALFFIGTVLVTVQQSQCMSARCPEEWVQKGNMCFVERVYENITCIKAKTHCAQLQQRLKKPRDVKVILPTYDSDNITVWDWAIPSCKTNTHDHVARYGCAFLQL